MALQEAQNGGSEKAATEVTFTAVKPQLLVEAPKANDAVTFYKAAFGAVETGRTTQPKRKAEQELTHIIYAELRLAGTIIVVSDIADDYALLSRRNTGVGIRLVLETDNVEAAIAKAVAAGAVAEGEIVEADGAYCGAGRVGKVKDPYGFVWVISSGAAKPSADVEA